MEAFEARKRDKARAEKFSHFALTSAKWHALGIDSASSTKSDKISIKGILGHAGVTMDQVKTAWQHHQNQSEDVGEDEFGISPLVSEHMLIESQYAHYINKQQKRVDQMQASNWDNLDISTVNLDKLKAVLSNEDYERLSTHKP